tara:strand:+ start:551 stop:778 length:228 start_codon:yes stop_codon:yes gene_type:complete
MSHSDGREAVEVFTSTSDKPYDRHSYRVIYGNGKAVEVGSYDEAQNLWYGSTPRPKVIEVVSQPKAKSKSTGGFK